MHIYVVYHFYIVPSFIYESIKTFVSWAMSSVVQLFRKCTEITSNGLFHFLCSFFYVVLKLSLNSCGNNILDFFYFHAANFSPSAVLSSLYFTRTFPYNTLKICIY